MTKIDEQARRTGGFSAGVPVELADGQTWHFPRVRIRLGPKPAGEGRHTVALARTADGIDLARYEGWIATLTSPTPVAGDVWWDASMDAAATMLRVNYSLSDDELSALLAWTEDDEPSEARWQAIREAIQGRGAPKAEPAGSGSPGA